MVEKTVKSQRPLSPHLQIYKPQISSVLSILHRATGCFLSIGSLLLAILVYAAAYDLELFASLADFFSGILGRILLTLWAGAFYYHLCNGIRHMFWDMGKGFSLPAMTQSGYAVLAGASALTVITLVCAWS